MTYDPGSSGEHPQQGNPGWPTGGQPGYPGGYGQQPGWGPPPGQPGYGMQPAPPPRRGAFSALFDYSFSSFATPGLVKLLYIVGSVLIVLGWLGYVIAAFTIPEVGAMIGILTLVFGSVLVLFMLAMLRVSLEFYFAVVRMSEDIHHKR
ncbi:DUF4282 domain-containing protein [Pseudonocardia nigra]|uniref:DUF4282 domain-containing protein n=1 Tax=Pseudonocardia nigra TaxID=1921578 RepID=UPI001C5CF118|nr:DUF4282 domain-containing protein [Pseudonocardia nigra]